LHHEQLTAALEKITPGTYKKKGKNNPRYLDELHHEQLTAALEKMTPGTYALAQVMCICVYVYQEREREREGEREGERESKRSVGPRTTDSSA